MVMSITFDIFWLIVFLDDENKDNSEIWIIKLDVVKIVRQDD